METFTIGVLDNIFITLAISIVCFGLTIGLFRRYVLRRYQKDLPFYALHWMFYGFMWVALSGSMYAGWSENISLSELLMRVALVCIVIQSGFLLVSLYVPVFNFKFNRILFSAIAFLISFVMLFFIYTNELTYKGIETWDNRWLLPDNLLISYVWLFFIPILLGGLLNLVKQGITYFKDRENFKLISFFIPFPVAIYSAVLVADLYNMASGLNILGLRLLFFVSISFVYGIYFSREIRRYNIDTDFRISSPLLVKAVFYSLFTTILPLGVVAVLLVYSVNALLYNTVLKDIPIVSAFLTEQIIVTAIIIGIFSFFITMIALKTVQNRIRAIIQGMYELLNNNFNYRIKEFQLRDEVSGLAFSFNSMAKDLNLYATEINNYRELLEDKVKERTDELQRSSKESEKLVKEIKSYYDSLQKRTDIITDEMGDGLLVLDNDYKVLRVNKVFLDQFGLIKEDTVGKSIKNIDILKKYSEFEDMILEFKDQGLESYNYKLQLKPPLSGMLQCRLTSFELSEDNSGIIFLLRDITPPWGVVYNAETLKPVDGVVVRLYNEANDKIVGSEVTDSAGRYTFYVSTGNYYIKAFKDNYHFPAENPLGYHGEVIEVKSKDEGIIHFDILIDRIGGEPEKEANEPKFEEKDSNQKENQKTKRIAPKKVTKIQEEEVLKETPSFIKSAQAIHKKVSGEIGKDLQNTEE